MSEDKRIAKPSKKDAAPAKKDSAKKPDTKKKKRFNLVQKYREMVAELKKVSWPSKKDLIRHSTVVIVFVLAITVVIGIYDYVLSALFKLLL